MPALLAFGVLLMWSWHATASEVTLDVHVTLVDKNDVPIANAPMRLVFGTAPGWDAPGAGAPFTTDAKGEHHFSTTAPLDIQRLKVPTNFFTQLVSLPEKTRHLGLAAELPYRGQPQRYIADVNRFPDGAGLRALGDESLRRGPERSIHSARRHGRAPAIPVLSRACGDRISRCHSMDPDPDVPA